MLVGQAITSIMVGRAEDVIRHPDGPNLYWALTTLPRPFIDPRPSLDGEARFSTSFLPWLKEMQAGPVSEEQAQKALRDTLRMMGGLAQDMPKEEKLSDLIGNFGLAAGLAAQGKQAKKDLLARGWKEKDVAAMPNAQAVILLTAAVHQEVWDDQVKLFHLPVPAAAAEMARTAQAGRRPARGDPDNPLIAVFAMLYPAVEKVHHAHVRVDRRLTQLRAVEAVRLHAAASGAVPKALADATTVPVPDDPATGKPFEYTAEGGHVHARAPRRRRGSGRTRRTPSSTWSRCGRSERDAESRDAEYHLPQKVAGSDLTRGADAACRDGRRRVVARPGWPSRTRNGNSSGRGPTSGTATPRSRSVIEIRVPGGPDLPDPDAFDPEDGGHSSDDTTRHRGGCRATG